MTSALIRADGGASDPGGIAAAMASVALSSHPWSCAACTFLNEEPTADRCAVCDTPHPHPHRKPPAPGGGGGVGGKCRIGIHVADVASRVSAGSALFGWAKLRASSAYHHGPNADSDEVRFSRQEAPGGVQREIVACVKQLTGPGRI